MNPIADYNSRQQLEAFLATIPVADKLKAFAADFPNDSWKFREKHGEYQPLKPFAYFQYLREVRNQLTELRYDNRRKSNNRSYAMQHSWEFLNKLADRANRILKLKVEFCGMENANDINSAEFKIFGDTERKKPQRYSLGELVTVRMGTNGCKRTFPSVTCNYNRRENAIRQTIDALFDGPSSDKQPIGLLTSMKLVHSEPTGEVYAIKFIQRETRERLSGFAVRMGKNNGNTAVAFAYMDDKQDAIEVLNQASVRLFNSYVSEF
jgi:hypothetical protein